MCYGIKAKVLEILGGGQFDSDGKIKCNIYVSLYTKYMLEDKKTFGYTCGFLVSGDETVTENAGDEASGVDIVENPGLLESIAQSLGETILEAILELFYSLGDVISSGLNNWMNNKLPFYVMIDAAQYNQDTDVKSETALATNASEIVITKDAVKDNEIENEIVSDAQIPKLLATPEAILQNKVAVLQTNVLGDENNISDKIWQAIHNFTTEIEY